MLKELAQAPGSEPDSFRSTFNRALPRVYSYLHQRIGADRVEAVSMTRESFGRLAHEWPVTEGDPSDRAMAIARVVLVSAIGRQSRRRGRSRRGGDGRASMPQAGDHEIRLHEAIGNLEATRRVALLLTYVDSLDAASAARVVDTTAAELAEQAEQAFAELQESVAATSPARLVRRLRELDRPVVVPDGLSSEIYDVVADRVASREGRIRHDMHDVFLQLAPLQAPELPRWRPGVVVLVLLLGAAAVTGTMTFRGGASQPGVTVVATEAPVRAETVEVAAAPAPPAPRIAVGLPEGPPGWVAVDPGPAAAPVPFVAVATDRELVVWGSGVMASYSPTTAAWSSNDPPPVPFRPGATLSWAGSAMVAVSPGDDEAAVGGEDGWTETLLPGGSLRSVAATVWDGTELIVLGTRSGVAVALAYDPVSGAWRELTAPGIALDEASAAWVGDRVMVVGSTAVDAGTVHGLVYEPAADVWRDMPPASVGADGVGAAAVAGRLVAVDASLRSAAFSVESGWLPLEAIPLGDSGCAARLASTGDTLVSQFCGGVARFDPLVLEWSRIAVPDSLAAAGASIGDPVALGDLVYFWGAVDDEPLLWSLDADEAIPGGSSTGVDGWSLLPPGAFDGAEANVTGIGEGDLLAWADAPFRAEVYESGSDEWRSLEVPAVALSASAWTGEYLVTFDDSGSVGRLDPFTGAWDHLPAPPAVVGAVAGAAWTGDRLLAWGEGVAVIELDAASWVPVRVDTGGRLSWSGTDLISVGSGEGGVVAARLDPEAGQWIAWEAGAERLDFVASVASSRAVFVAGVAEDASFEASGTGRLWYLDTVAGDWHLIPDPPIDVAALQSGNMVWTGSRLAIWDPSSRNPVVWLYNPLSAEWSSTAYAPQATPDVTLSWAGDRIVVTGTERVLTYELGLNGATLPTLPGFETAIGLDESIPLTLFAFDPLGDAGGAATVIDLAAGVRTDYGPGEHQVEPPDQASGLASGGFASIRDGQVTWHPAALYRSGSSIWASDESTPATIVATMLPSGGDGVWIVETGSGVDGGPLPVRLVSAADGEIQLNSELAPSSTPVQATADGLVVDLIDFVDTANGPVPDPETAEMALLEPGGRLVPLGDGTAVAVAGDTILRLVCPGLVERDCALRLTVPGGDNDSVAAPGGTSWVPFTQPGASLASPNGRWAVAAVSENSDVDGNLLPALVNVDLARAEVLPFGRLTGRGLSAVWSADSRWLVVFDDAAMAYNVEQGRWVSLEGVVPDGLTVYAAN